MGLKKILKGFEYELDLTKNGYKFNKPLFYFMMFVLVVSFVWVWSLDGFSFDEQVYLSCPSDFPTMCKNRLYNTCDEPYCQLEYISPGYEYGTPPNVHTKNFYVYVILFVIFVLLLNHFLFNRGYKFYYFEEDKEDGGKNEGV